MDRAKSLLMKQQKDVEKKLRALAWQEQDLKDEIDGCFADIRKLQQEHTKLKGYIAAKNQTLVGIELALSRMEIRDEQPSET